MKDLSLLNFYDVLLHCGNFYFLLPSLMVVYKCVHVVIQLPLAQFLFVCAHKKCRFPKLTFTWIDKSSQEIAYVNSRMLIHLFTKETLKNLNTNLK
jgi:hypothetical protein